MIKPVNSTRADSTRAESTRVDSTGVDSTRVDSTRINSTRVDSTRVQNRFNQNRFNQSRFIYLLKNIDSTRVNLNRRTRTQKFPITYVSTYLHKICTGYTSKPRWSGILKVVFVHHETLILVTLVLT